MQQKVVLTTGEAPVGGTVTEQQFSKVTIDCVTGQVIVHCDGLDSGGVAIGHAKFTLESGTDTGEVPPADVNTFMAVVMNKAKDAGKVSAGTNSQS